MNKIVCHLTSVHSWDDVRIFHKECCTLAKAGFEVHLVSPGAPFENINSVQLHGVPKGDYGRLSRMTKTVFSIYQTALSINANIYHIHDPELLIVGLILKLRGKKVIFDMHENIAAQIFDKTWVPSMLRGALSITYKMAQAIMLYFFDYIVLAEESYKNIRLPGCRTTTIKNYPILSEFSNNNSNSYLKDKSVCYIGRLTYIRGLKEIVLATNKAKVKLILAGPCSEKTLSDISAYSEWSTTEFVGKVNRSQVASILSRSFAGLVVLHPVPNYVATEPTKMFEYMAAGIPVISSNFPLWRQIVEENNCGICVDPFNYDEIAKAIEWLLEHPEEAKQMGENGRLAVVEKYIWERESEKLVRLYQF